VNGELQYESRYMLKLFADVDQIVSLPQDFFTTAPPPILIVADDLAP
jgi:hypothetical protein